MLIPGNEGDSEQALPPGAAVAARVWGAVSRLAGWAFPELPIRNGAARVLCVKGAVWAVRGIDAAPEKEPGGMSIDSVGSFVLSRGPQQR